MINGCTDLSRALSALQAIPPDCDRDRWVRVGMAAHAAGLSFDDFDQWSAPADSYDRRAARDTWRSFKPTPGGVTAGALFGMARDHGWSGDGYAQRHAPARPERARMPAEPPRKPAPGMSASEVWNRCEAAKAHGYATAKQASPEALQGLRVVPAGDPLRIMGESMAGSLVLPCWAADGTLSTLQLIPPPDVAQRLKAAGRPGKLNLPGHSVQGWFTVGHIETGKTIYIVEGLGTAWAAWQATGCPAVVTFGAGRFKAVAEALRQKDVTAHLVLCPDRGKEDAAKTIATELNCAVTEMPEGWSSNSDLSDLLARDGVEAVASLLAGAAEPPRPDHPISLSKAVRFEAVPKAVDFVVDDFIQEGVVFIAGQQGIGKTSAICPLALAQAGLHEHGYQFGPKKPGRWRHVVYLAEDAAQVSRMVAAMVAQKHFTLEQVQERFHVVPAVTMSAESFIKVRDEYAALFANESGIQLKPLVVCDTRSACFLLESENDNSQMSALVGSLKQNFADIPIWLVAHIAKDSATRTNAASLSVRGAGSAEGDAHQVLFLVREADDSRWLVRGKTRFESPWRELSLRSELVEVQARDRWGDTVTMNVRWAVAEPPQATRTQIKEQAAELQRQQAESELRQEVMDVVQTAWNVGQPLNREAVKSKIKKQRNAVTATLETLLAEGWIYEVSIPPKQRTNPNRKAYLVAFTAEQHEHFLANGVVPDAMLAVPQSWQKPVTPSVPDEFAFAIESEAS